MIPHHSQLPKKLASLALQRDPKQNKQNRNINIQQKNTLQLMHKPNKIRASLEPLTKNLNSLRVSPLEDASDLHLNLKKKYSQLTKTDYSQSILTHLISKNKPINGVLSNHAINFNLRAKMVDWMIQVLSSYKMSEDCFFRSVKYMDLFFLVSKRRLQVADLHLVGVVSMFIASKYEEIYPLKLGVIYDKICRKKFPKEDLLNMEEQIISCLSFQLQQVTCYDILCHILEQLQISLNPKEQKYLKKVSLYLSKMSMHCLQLAQLQNSLLGGANLFIALKTVEQVDESLKADDYLQRIATLAQIDIGILIECSQKLLNLAKNFNKSYPSLSNLKKFNNAQYYQ